MLHVLSAVLPALKEALESCASSFEVMKEVVAAVSDAERGRSTSMAGLLANVQSRQASRLAEQTQQVLTLPLGPRSCAACCSLECAAAPAGQQRSACKQLADRGLHASKVVLWLSWAGSCRWRR